MLQLIKNQHKMSKYSINENGYYGEFGGAYVPEILRKNVVELKENYLKIMGDPDRKIVV